MHADVMMSGDNMLTALSVARQCGMVGQRDRVVLIHAHAPEPDAAATGAPAAESGGRMARISWELAGSDMQPTDSAVRLEDLQGVSDRML